MNSYSANTASLSQIIALFQNCIFDPPLDSYINVNDYTAKILKFAQRFECWHGDALVGLVAMYANDQASRSAFITMVSVANNFGGKGIASSLLGQAIGFAEKENYNQVALEVFSGNLKAIRLYEKLGFKRVPGEGEVKIRMEKQLEAGL